jgi:transcriptional regulator with XRE-family HTH domain
MRQADLAKAAGYSVSTISRLETGRRPAVDLDLLRGVPMPPESRRRSSAC